MPKFEGHHGRELTHHIAMARLFYGRTSAEWWRIYGTLAVLWFLCVLTYTRYLELFDDIHNQPADYQTFVMIFSGSGLLVLLPAVAAFIWWAAGALVQYSLWQRRQPRFWRWFWVVVLVFFLYVEFDPLDAIHPLMSHKGLGNAPDLIAMFDVEYSLSQGIPWMKFQWGYFLLWALFLFLIAVLHWQYFVNAFREVWFYTQRFHRYGASVLTGFSETHQAQLKPPVTADYPEKKPQLPPAFRGVPRQRVATLTDEQARAIIAADASGAIVSAPGQPAVLFVDLGRFDYSPQLAELTTVDGTPLLSFDDWWAEPAVNRSELVVPLNRSAPGGEA